MIVPESWNEERHYLVREFIFADFKSAFYFMTAVAGIAEELNHHPDWSNSYNRVTIRLTTHDAGNTITEKDIILANRINEVFGKFR